MGLEEAGMRARQALQQGGQYQILSLDPAKTAEQIARSVRSYAVIHYYDPQNIFSGMSLEEVLLLGARVIKIFTG